MSAVLPHYKQGPASYQVAGLIYGGQLVANNNQTAGSTDFTVRVATNGTDMTQVLGVAGGDANVITAQAGTPNTYGQPLIDISVLGDYVSVHYGGVDIWVWYSAQTNPGALLMLGNTVGCVAPFSGTTYSQILGRCTNPGGVASGQLTQQIGGQGSASFYLGRARIF